MQEEPRAHVIDALYVAMRTLDPAYLDALRGVRVTEEERGAAESLLMAAL